MFEKIKAFLGKAIQWLAAILATAIGFGEVILKFVKELLTLIVDILFPIIPAENFKKIVTAIRAWVDVAYNWLSANKDKILKWIGAING
jgi:hypothetical protein